MTPIELTFTFYLEAWLYCTKNNVSMANLKKVGIQSYILSLGNEKV